MISEGRWAQIIGASNDKGPYKILRVQSEGHEFDAMVIEPYGVQGSPLKEGQAFLLPMNMDTGQAVVMVMPPPSKRTDQQKEGEVSYVHHETGNKIQHNNDGDTKHTSSRDVIVETQRSSVVSASSDHRVNTGGVIYLNC